jgi:hypothetical protein
MKLKYITIAAFAAAMTVGCTNGEHDAESEEEIVRLDHVLYNYKNMSDAERARMRDLLNAPIKALSQVLNLDTLCDESLLAWSASMPVEMFSPMADTAFVRIDNFEKQLGTSLSNARDNGLTLPKRHYVAVVWGRAESIVFNDSIALIALNHYLGANSPAYEHWASYKRALKRKDMLVYDIVEATVATEYPYAPKAGENTVLSRLLYEGALAYVKMQIMPDAKLSNALGLSEQQVIDTESNLAYIWGKMAAENMLYSSDADLMERLFAQLPYTSPISPKAPGRCVRLLGYKIVQSYVKHNKDVSLLQLLSPEFYSTRQTLSDAKFSAY